MNRRVKNLIQFGVIGLTPLSINIYLFKSNAPIPMQIGAGLLTSSWCLLTSTGFMLTQ